MNDVNVLKLRRSVFSVRKNLERRPSAEVAVTGRKTSEPNRTWPVRV